LANIALDLLGQARMLLARAGRAEGDDRDEDDLAFRRPAAEFGNVTLAEIPDGDFAACIARLFVFSVWRLDLLAQLRESADPVLAAIAAKGVAELTYHRDYAADWVVRLGDGTVESADRMAAGLVAVAPYVDELFAVTSVERDLPAVAVHFEARRGLGTLGDVLVAATSTRSAVGRRRGREAGTPGVGSAARGDAERGPRPSRDGDRGARPRRTRGRRVLTGASAADADRDRAGVTIEEA
jgi:ring-1,2-phenylacetyl-CoA epoxidase subunit PaaC